VSGSIISSISIDGSTIGEIIIRNGNVNDSVFTDISITETTFYEEQGNLTISGSHPNLSNLVIDGVTLNQFSIGTVVTEFPNLISLTISNVTANRITIGDRDVDFSSLLHLTLLNVICENDIKFTGENADFTGIQDITITNVSASNILFGGIGLYGVTSIICNDLNIEENLTIFGGSGPSSLELAVLKNVDANAVMINYINSTFDLYVEESNLTNLSVENGCQKIYVPETDVTAWDFYSYATENSIPVETGTYNPS
jgi:hypothetical protein